MSGWFSCKRGITSHPLFKGHPERLAIWIWLLDNAAWKDTKTDVNGRTVDVPRGSVSVSERRISEETGVGYQVVRTFIARLQTEQMINARLTHGRKLISLKNWDRYQRPDSDPNAGGNARLTQDQRTKETREQEIRDDKSSPSSSVAPASSPPKAKTVQPARPKAERFPEFWDSAYPHLERKIARGKCEAKYRSLVASGVPEDAMICGARSYGRTQRVRDGKVCNPLTWLNQRRWEDEAADIIPLREHPTQQRTKGNDKLAIWLDAARNPR